MRPTASDCEAMLAALQQASPTAPIARRPNAARLTRVLQKIHTLRMEGFRLATALPHLEPFCACDARWRILDGSNRASKTFTCAMEFVRFFLGVDPYDKYVRYRGNSIVIAQELDDVARIWRTIAEPGQFKIIPDERTGLYRAVRPDPNDPRRLDPYDEAYREKWRDGAPLLPKRALAREPAWENFGKGVPRVAESITGARALFCTSGGTPRQGDRYDFAHIDEQLNNGGFFREVNRGLVGLADTPPKHRPKGIWSATSQTTNLQLWRLRQAADSGARHVRAFTTTIDQNPFVPDDEKRLFFESLSPEEREVRYFGHYAVATRRIYGIYQPQGVHGCEPFPIPHDWCRYFVLDPGVDYCGTLFLAVDPEQKHVWVYDGMLLRQNNANSWAEQVARRQGETCFHAAVCDGRAGSQHGMVGLVTVASEYWKAAMAAGVKIATLGTMDGFFPGLPDVEARTQALLNWMQVRGVGPFTGTPRLKVFRGAVPDLDQQLLEAHTDPDKPNKRAKGKEIHEDVLVCLEYAAPFNPQYYEPKPLVAQPDRTVWDAFQEKENRRRRRESVRQELGEFVR